MRTIHRLCVLAPLVLAAVSAPALADGGPPVARSAAPAASPIAFSCRGGVRVQVTPLDGAARVQFAGQTRTLGQVGETTYRNAEFTWFTQPGGTAAMRTNLTGRLRLSGCRPE